MFFSEVVAMGMFMAAVTSCFLGGVFGAVWLTHRSIQAYLGYLQRDLELRRYITDTQMEQARLQASIPVWVDRNDPAEVAAWNRAVAETWRISAHRALRSPAD